MYVDIMASQQARQALNLLPRGEESSSLDYVADGELQRSYNFISDLRLVKAETRFFPPPLLPFPYCALALVLVWCRFQQGRFHVCGFWRDRGVFAGVRADPFAAEKHSQMASETCRGGWINLGPLEMILTLGYPRACPWLFLLLTRGSAIVERVLKELGRVTLNGLLCDGGLMAG